jgi:sodium transport system ATP-binding protein
MIQVTDLTKQFPKVLALDHVSFETKTGEVFGLLGPNGAGKTTTIRLILSILKPTAGKIFIDGVDVTKDPERVRSKIGAVLEDNGVYDRLTARENVEFFGKLNGMASARLKERIDELFRLFEMEEFANRRAGTFSKGMKQKVAVARALVADPPILILDEPTAGLDVITKRSIIDFVKKEKARGKCILYSTHIMSEAEEICDRVGIIHHGRLRAVGTIPTLKSKVHRDKLEDVFMTLVQE